MYNYEIKDKGLTLPCGWVYHVPETNMDVKADDWDELVQKTRDIYTINHRDIPEDLEKQIERHICLLCPTGICGSFFNRLAFSTRTLMNGTSAFAMMMRQGKGGLVSGDVAEDRAKVCVECSYNTKNPPCYTCKSFETIIQRIIGHRKTTKDDQLNVCGMCGCFIRAMVHCDVGVLQAATRDKDVARHPDHCWKKKLLTKE